MVIYDFMGSAVMATSGEMVNASLFFLLMMFSLKIILMTLKKHK